MLYNIDVSNRKGISSKKSKAIVKKSIGVCGCLFRLKVRNRKYLYFRT